MTNPKLALAPQMDCGQPPSFEIAASALDLSTPEWQCVLQSHLRAPSSRRKSFPGETIGLQAKGLGMRIHDDDPCAERNAPCRRIEEMPHDLKPAIVEVIEPFWASETRGDLEEKLGETGIRYCHIHHARMRVSPTIPGCAQKRATMKAA